MAVVYRCVGILTVDVVVFFRNPGVFRSQDSFPSTFRPRLWEPSSGVVAVGVFAAEMSPTAGDETSRGRNPENGRSRDLGRRRRHRQSGFQHTDRPRPSSPELFNKDQSFICLTSHNPVLGSSYYHYYYSVQEVRCILHFSL